MRSSWTALALVLASPVIARAGHSAPSYIDGGQSADGRFVVTAELTDGKQTSGPFRWTFIWKDTKTGETRRPDLAGVSTGQIYAHIFVAPDGETFALWNPLSYHIPAGKTSRITADADRAAPAWRTRAEFSKRLMVFRKTGELVKELAVGDFIKPEEWSATLAVFERMEWLKEYDGLAFKKTPRAGYSMYRVSADYTVLEITIKPTRDDKTRAGRTLRVSLTDGKLLDAKEWLSTPEKTPVRPFLGAGDVSTLSTEIKEKYQPSLDPVRSAGKFPQ